MSRSVISTEVSETVVTLPAWVVSPLRRDGAPGTIPPQAQPCLESVTIAGRRASSTRTTTSAVRSGSTSSR